MTCAYVPLWTVGLVRMWLNCLTSYSLIPNTVNSRYSAAVMQGKTTTMPMMSGVVNVTWNTLQAMKAIAMMATMYLEADMWISFSGWQQAQQWGLADRPVPESS